MRNQTISHRQLAWLIAAGFMTSTTILLPQQLALYSGNDAWFAPLFCAIYALLACYVFYRLAKRYPGQTIFQITKLLAGKWIGSLLNIIILFNIWLIFVRNSRLFINFVKLNLLPSTPEEILLLLLVVVLIYYGSTSIEVTARVNELFFPFLFLSTLMLPILLSNELSIYQLEPVLVKPASDLTLSGLIASSWYGDVIVVGAFLHTIYNSKQLYSAMRHGILLSVFGLTILCIVGIAVLGANTLGKENYPSYVLAEQIHISDFLDRVELILFSIYFPTFLVSIMTAFLALLIGVASFTKTRDYTFYSRSMGWLMLLAVYLAFPGGPETRTFATYSFPPFVLTVQPVLFLVLLMLALWKKTTRSGHEKGQQEEEEGANGKEEERDGSREEREARKMQKEGQEEQAQGGEESRVSHHAHGGGESQPPQQADDGKESRIAHSAQGDEDSQAPNRARENKEGGAGDRERVLREESETGKGRSGREDAVSASGNHGGADQPTYRHTPGSAAKKLKKRWSLPVWRRVTHLLLGLGIVLIAAGHGFGLNHQWVGLLCAIGYAVCLTLAVLTTYMESKKAGSQ
ncbi:endospore germination permease [Paenibacillus aurantius]|uniref:Endospore germination permease n=1 Tax=Paenibacillus aurantius TaxID=2918900 RepID=A0AA96LCA5_9BACL|nr:endospore germination permease [Paenibacillus aurantius]WNQ10458.1 endospore germination permease [Paenibacillus aurantius]